VPKAGNTINAAVFDFSCASHELIRFFALGRPAYRLETPAPAFPDFDTWRASSRIVPGIICHRDNAGNNCRISPVFVIPECLLPVTYHKRSDDIRRICFRDFGPQPGADWEFVVGLLQGVVVGERVGFGCQFIRYPTGSSIINRKVISIANSSSLNYRSGLWKSKTSNSSGDCRKCKVGCSALFARWFRGRLGRVVLTLNVSRDARAAGFSWSGRAGVRMRLFSTVRYVPELARRQGARTMTQKVFSLSCRSDWGRSARSCLKEEVERDGARAWAL